MIDLNIIARVTTTGSFFLPLAEGINGRGEIVGTAVDRSTGNTLGFAAVPCDNLPADKPGCADDHTTLATEGPKAVWRDIGVGLLHNPLGSGLFRNRPFGFH